MTLDELRKNYKEAIVEMAARYHAEDVRVFGSLVRGEHGEHSDIDLLVHFREDASLLDEAGLDLALNDLLDLPVDVVGDDVIREELKPFIMAEAVRL